VNWKVCARPTRRKSATRSSRSARASCRIRQRSATRSFFKNPVVDAALRNALLADHPALVSYPQPDGSYKLAAGWLIDQCGFKGVDDGPVGVYGKQALVLVHRRWNRRGAAGAG
jgi:UDP-N-acetylenolpyruvoylglucosamine reductase